LHLGHHLSRNIKILFDGHRKTGIVAVFSKNQRYYTISLKDEQSYT